MWASKHMMRTHPFAKLHASKVWVSGGAYKHFRGTVARGAWTTPSDPRTVMDAKRKPGQPLGHLAL
jgi:hypothetical protein